MSRLAPVHGAWPGKPEPEDDADYLRALGDPTDGGLHPSEYSREQYDAEREMLKHPEYAAPQLLIRYLDVDAEAVAGSDYSLHPTGRYVSLADLQELLSTHPWMLAEMLAVVTDRVPAPWPTAAA